MLKVRVIPILTFNGLSLVKTKQFKLPRTVGNPIQSARVFNSRNVDELVFIDIMASKMKRKINLNLVENVIEECFMPVTIGGGISSFEDISNLLKIGADKVLIKTKALNDINFIRDAVNYFGSQCISISVDVQIDKKKYFIQGSKNNNLVMEDFICEMNKCDVGEYVINCVSHDGCMKGYDIKLLEYSSLLTQKPIIAVGGAGNPDHFIQLINSNFYGAIGASSIFHFTQYTPNDIKNLMKKNNIQVRV
tara:strand:+ start:61335 stop:62081 length:747 start_codon:yes stop_codon:yes gene_type:complete